MRLLTIVIDWLLVFLIDCSIVNLFSRYTFITAIGACLVCSLAGYINISNYVLSPSIVKYCVIMCTNCARQSLKGVF